MPCPARIPLNVRPYHPPGRVGRHYRIPPRRSRPSVLRNPAGQSGTHGGGGPGGSGYASTAGGRPPISISGCRAHEPVSVLKTPGPSRLEDGRGRDVQADIRQSEDAPCSFGGVVAAGGASAGGCPTQHQREANGRVVTTATSGNWEAPAGPGMATDASATSIRAAAQIRWQAGTSATPPNSSFGGFLPASGRGVFLRHLEPISEGRRHLPPFAGALFPAPANYRLSSDPWPGSQPRRTDEPDGRRVTPCDRQPRGHSQDTSLGGEPGAPLCMPARALPTPITAGRSPGQLEQRV